MKKHINYFISYYLCSIVLCFSLLACGSDSKDLDGEGTGESNTDNKYLYLQTYGLNSVSIQNSDYESKFDIVIRRSGGATSQVTANLETWTDNEMIAYNNKEKTNFTCLPSSLYTLSQSSVTFKDGESEVIATLKFNPVSFFTYYKSTKANYAIGLKLKSTDAQLKSSQSNIVVNLNLSYPTISFANTLFSVSLTSEPTIAKIPTKFTYMFNGAAVANSSNFSCKYVVAEKPDELVKAYNYKYNTSYELLPAYSYSLNNNSINYKSGENESYGFLSISKSNLQVKEYILPLALSDENCDKAICDNQIAYLKVGRTYTNPIITETSVPDPTVFRGKDGYFYLYATHVGSNWMPIYRSKNLVNWEYVKNAFSNATKPTIPGGGSFWAPEVQYINNKYVLYFSWAKMNGADQSYTAVATSDSPTGPFPDSKELIGNAEFGSNVIDQFFYEENGKKYMFFGSFVGIYVVELTDDGLSVKRGLDGKPVLYKKVCGNAFEGTNIYKKNGYYYLFASINNCCNGVNSNYKVVVGRSKDILGPYVDKQGKGMLNNSWELVLEGDGHKWIGPGHNSVLIQDDEGNDWMIYHSYVKAPDGTVGGRLGMLDRVLWSDDGWPYIKNCVPSNESLVPIFN